MSEDPNGHIHKPGPAGAWKSERESGELVDTLSGVFPWEYEDDSGKPTKLLDLGKDDPRYQASLAEARRLRGLYPLAGLNPENPQDREKIETYERSIATGIVAKIHEQYGNYNPKIASGVDSGDNEPTMHHDLKRATDAAAGKSLPPSLKEFQKGELICRHYAPLAAALLTEAGLPNLIISGHMNDFSIKYGEAIPSTDSTAKGQTWHDFVVSRLTGNVIESTADDAKYAYENQVIPRSLNDIVDGKTIVTSHRERFSAYSSGEGSDPHSDFEEQRTQALNYDQQLAAWGYATYVKPVIDGFNQAVQTGDAAEAERNYRLAPYQFDKSDLAAALEAAIVKQNLPLAHFLISNHALEGFNPPKITSEDKAYLLFFEKPAIAWKAPFIQGMMQELGITEKDVLAQAKNLNQSQEALAVFPEAQAKYREALQTGDRGKLGDIPLGAEAEKKFQSAQRDLLKDAVHEGNIPEAELLLKSGVTIDKGYLAGELMQALTDQQSSKATFLISNGALDGFTDKIDTAEKKAEMLFWNPHGDPTKWKPDFVKDVINAMGITEKDVLDYAAKNNWSQATLAVFPETEARVKKAIADGTPETISDIPLGTNELMDALKGTIHVGNVSAAEALMKQKHISLDNDKGFLAWEMEAALRDQNADKVNFLAKQGAWDGYAPPVHDPQIKANILAGKIDPVKLKSKFVCDVKDELNITIDNIKAALGPNADKVSIICP